MAEYSPGGRIRVTLKIRDPPTETLPALRTDVLMDPKLRRSQRERGREQSFRRRSRRAPVKGTALFTTTGPSTLCPDLDSASIECIGVSFGVPRFAYPSALGSICSSSVIFTIKGTKNQAT
ncbi:hypothetical protein RF11_01478 [Thelohanellus kitauei]|uniref:Uncharacterized protein n=1 Tax=Thelohanellus kitauei TaxID=669202 RepID=A0A0C2JGZ6_THEKT|nr:hypothetical protein RF11_01478 [Thelohanellus kitauei]